MVVVVVMMMMMMMSNFVSLLSSSFLFFSFFVFFSALSSDKLAINWPGSKTFLLIKAEAISATRTESVAILR